jgi:nucleoside-diphosphate-sugar epimerase
MTAVLVLGGTGAMGNELVACLANDGFDVFVTTRETRPQSPNCKFVVGNALQDEFLDEVLNREWDVIVDFMVYRTSVFQKRIERLLSAARQYIFVSSARVYADSKEALTEDSPRLLDVTHDSEYLMTDEYALTKARQENQLFASSRKNWTIVRPYITYGDQRLQLGTLEKELWLYRALRGRSIVFAEELASRKTTMTWSVDVASAIRNLICNPNALGEAFNVCSTHSVSWNKVLEVYVGVLNSKLEFNTKVKFVDLNAFSTIRAANYQIYYDRIYNRSFDNSKLQRVAGLVKFHDVESGLQKCIEKFLVDPAFKAVEWRSEAIMDRMCGEFSWPSEISGYKNKLKYLASRLNLRK